MTLSIEIRNYLLKNGATEVGFSDITNLSPKSELNRGIIFFITYSKEIIRNMENAPTPNYFQELCSSLNFLIKQLLHVQVLDGLGNLHYLQLKIMVLL